jgi:hypothetical protein
MGIRLPLQTVVDYNDVPQTGAGSVAGGVAVPFTLPQDTDNVVVKLTASVIGGGVSAVFQTTDDGGSTWYDVARTSVVSNANSTTAEWLSIPVVGMGVTSSRPVTGSVMGTTGSAAASTLASGQFSGLPIMSQYNRIFMRYTAAITSTDLARVQVKVNNQNQGQ